MKAAYGVRWDEGGKNVAGRLTIAPHSFHLSSLEDPDVVLRDLPFEDIAAIEAHAGDGKKGRSTVVIESRTTGRIEIESVVDRWILVDVLEKAFQHGVGGANPRERRLVAVRLKPGCRAAALELLRSGPPFELSNSAIDVHDVFLLEDEVLFFFEAGDSSGSDEHTRRLWDAASAWRELIADIRVAEHAYTWTRDKTVRETHPGLGL